jgi:hypothetical protein
MKAAATWRENCDEGMLRWRSVEMGMSQYESQVIRACGAGDPSGWACALARRLEMGMPRAL